MNNVSLGLLQDINTLTALSNKISKQTYYTVKCDDYVDFDIGKEPGAEQIIEKRVAINAGKFGRGNVEQGQIDGKYALVDTVYDYKTFYRRIEMQQIKFNAVNDSVFQHLKIDDIGDKVKAIKKTFDLGLQETVFLGDIDVNGKITGLLNNKEITIDTQSITKDFKNMSDSEFFAALASMLESFIKNSKKTCYPNRLILPTETFSALGLPASSTFPTRTREEYIKQYFGRFRKDFQILESAYASKDINGSVNIYMLYEKDSDNMTYDLPKPYHMTDFFTYNGVDFTATAYMQYGSVKILWPERALYFQFK